MKEFKISETQIQALASVLMEFPAKNVFNALDLLRNLPLIVEQNTEKKPD
jgi:hypothetical protein